MLNCILAHIKLTELTRSDDGTNSYVIFVVRDDRQADLIAQTSDFTWQAYNRWPEDHSLYSNGDDQLTTYYGRDVAVTFDRPYLTTTFFNSPLPGTGEYFVFEYPFTFWLEKSGYDVTYCSGVDTHRGTAGFGRAKGFLSIGHDEYVTRNMYDNLIAARDSGLSLGFFTANAYCFEIGIRPNRAGVADRNFNRHDSFGPDRSPESGFEADDSLKEFAAAFPFPMDAPDEAMLIGARSTWPVTGVADWTCTLPDHWIFKGTGMAKGDSIPNLVGHEWHGGPADLPGLEVVSTGPTWEPNAGPAEYTATVYPGPHANFVFNASTCWWATGLALPPGFQRPTSYNMPSALPDARVQQITRNVLDRMLSGPGCTSS
ncbi:N,N-dimethylformamidase beta subunit family domain-containing protein [Streptomyces hydrogenans]|uniref:N,N-dimethylformamidase beta subunit family domain-containing protein n=1 Tax=Streptomyces hydrogenans TaxID=1873719 RepID=UPI00363A753F